MTFVALRDLVSALTLSRSELSTVDALMSASLPEAVALAETALDLSMAPFFGLAVGGAGAALVLFGAARAKRAAVIATIVTMSCSLLWGATEDRLAERFGLVWDSSAFPIEVDRQTWCIRAHRLTTVFHGASACLRVARAQRSSRRRTSSSTAASSTATP